MKVSYLGQRSKKHVLSVVRREEYQDEIGTTTLDPRLDIVRHSPDGFEWGYSGSGPTQLAIAILADFTRNDTLATKYCKKFVKEIVSQLPRDSWRITEDHILKFLRVFTIEEDLCQKLTEGS